MRRPLSTLLLLSLLTTLTALPLRAQSQVATDHEPVADKEEQAAEEQQEPQVVETTQDQDDEVDLGRLPESFDMALDSLLNARYKEYYSLSKPRRREQQEDIASKDELYSRRLKQMESAIPLTYNPAVREAIDLYVNRRSTLMSVMLSRASYYFPIIEEELDRQGLPLELKYLAIVESALSPTAVSRMGATGFWQFMLRTGKIYGLEINSLVDERMDPRKSTRAMCEYFKDMYALYGDWMLSIAAYNCGPGNVNKAIRRSGGKRDFWEIFPYLPRETRSYVPFFIAAFYSMEYYREHDIHPVPIHMPIATDTVHIDIRCTTKELAEMTKVPLETVELLNPMYKKGIIPGNQRPQVIELPSQEAITFAAEKDTLLAKLRLEEELEEAREAAVERVTYTVRRGESLGSIARKHHVTVAQLKEWNNLTSNMIHPGQPLVIAGGKVASSTTAAAPKAKSKKATTTGATRYYTVKKGDTLSGIAAKYRGVSVRDIKRANGLRSNRIDIGQRLIIPE